jgi:type IV pilus assembly protein PilA
MNKIYKTKRGFTLVEMVLVIAIIVLLAAVVGISVSGIISKGKSGSASVNAERETFQANNAEKNSAFAEFGY